MGISGTVTLEKKKKMNGFAVQLWQSNKNLQNTTTAQNGTFFFSITTQGNYKIIFKNPPKRVLDPEKSNEVYVVVNQVTIFDINFAQALPGKF